jgi:hypothetical protein
MDSVFDFVESGLQFDHRAVFHILPVISYAQNSAHDGLFQGVALRYSLDHYIP